VKLLCFLYGCSFANVGDLGFVEGDLIEVLNTGDGNWWMGKLRRNKMVGVFPCNFVEFVDNLKESKPAIISGSVRNSPMTVTNKVYKTREAILDDISSELNATVSGVPTLDSSGSSSNSWMSAQRSFVGGHKEDDARSERSFVTSDDRRASYYHIPPTVDSDYSDDNSVIYRQNSFDTGDDLCGDMPNTPPVPPAHKVPVGNAPSSPTGYRPNLDRTPSPLRNAMDDVLESLENMQDISRTSSSAVMNRDWSGSSYSGGLGSAKRQSSITVTQSTNYDLNDSEDDGYIPFDPSSYDNIATPNSAWPIARADTYKSMSSINTNSLSIITTSTTPSSVSNLSATSAGSLARHKLEHRRSESTADFPAEMPVKLPNSKSSDSKSAARSLKLRKSAGFIRKLFTGSSGNDHHPRQPNPDLNAVELKRSKSRQSRISVSSSSSKFRNSLRSVSQKTVALAMGGSHETLPAKNSASWIEIRRDVHRANSLTANEQQLRIRLLEMQGISILKPCRSLELRANETKNDRTDVKRKFNHVDEVMLGLRSWPQLMTPSVFATSKIARQFDKDLDRLRAIFDFCASKITWQEPLPGDEEEEDDEALLRSSRVMQKRRATPRELAVCMKSMCDAVGIVCQVIHGRLKIPGEIIVGTVQPNHYWNSVIINNECKLMDAMLANPSFPSRDAYYKSDGSLNHFYFLVSPSKFIYSHVASDPKHQYLVPPLNNCEALPYASPDAFKYNLRLVDYHTGQTRLNNLDVAELDIQVPKGVELIAEVVIGAQDDAIKIPSLCQAFWKDNTRFFRVKAFLPEPHSQGIVNVYVGEQGVLQSINRNVLALAYSVAITHIGQNAPFEFVTRHPTPHCKRQDLYVQQPQCKRLVEGHTYVFSVKQHPSGGVTAGSGFSKIKIAVQSPSGKITKLQKNDSSVHGFWDATIKCHEVGVWRGLVLADAGNAWSVFAEWYSV
jgi:transglutaminase/protease-like cytokinesis protein 3